MATLTSDAKSLRLAVLRQISHLSINRIYLAYSGGVDSSVLLHILAELKTGGFIPDKLEAIHVDHNLNPDSKIWERHCKAECIKLKLKYQSHKVPVDENKPSLEAEARKARYKVFENLLQAGDALMMAQHQDDQVETFFLRLLRGAGAHGLSAIPAKRALGKGVLLRPWLDISKSVVLKYAVDNNLKWIEDTSNQDLRFDRNFLRVEIIPKLKTRWPGLNKTITRAAGLIGKLPADNFQFAATLEISSLTGLTAPDAENLIYQWLRHLDAPNSSLVKIQNIIKEVAFSKQDSKAYVSLKPGEVRRYAGRLYYLETKDSLKSVTTVKTYKGEALLALIEDGKILPILDTVRLELVKDEDGFGVNPEDTVEIKFPEGGEKIKPRNNKHTKSLKNIFQENKIPPWQRRKTPLVYLNAELVQVVNICVAELSATIDEADNRYIFKETST